MPWVVGGLWLVSGVSRAVDPVATDRGRDVWMAKAPLEPALWPDAGHPVNRDRLFDFYAKQADYFSTQPDVLGLILPEFPGLDSGLYGHWGNQNEDVWKDGRWNATDHGSVVSNVWRGAGMTIPKAVSIRLSRAQGSTPGLSAVFNPSTATWDAVWRGGFVTYSDIRRGFMDGATMAGEVVTAARAGKPPLPVVYRGFYRHAEKVIFNYLIGGREVLDWAEAKDGAMVRHVVPSDSPAAGELTLGGPGAMAGGGGNAGRLRRGGSGRVVCHRHARASIRQPMEGRDVHHGPRFLRRWDRCGVHDGRRGVDGAGGG